MNLWTVENMMKRILIIKRNLNVKRIFLYSLRPSSTNVGLNELS